MKKTSLRLTLFFIALVPMLVLALIILAAGSSFVTYSLNKEVQNGMVDLSRTVELSLDEIYPGEYHAKEMNGELYFFKGEHAFNSDFKFIDALKERTGCDITVFYKQYSVISTLTNSKGERLIGSGDKEQVVEDILVKGLSKLYVNAYIGKQSIYAYYSPLHDASGEVIGMLLISQPTEYIDTLVWKTILPILCIAFVACVIVSFFVLRYTKGFAMNIKKIQSYMNSLANGDFNTELDLAITRRTDEIGQMGNSAVKMSASLQKKVEEDLLTGLLNRRSAEKKISKTMKDYIYKGVNFCVALGDIDYFKRVNDTYGHEAGDAVLITISKLLKSFAKTHGGYAIRWGGEEFLLVFENARIDVVTEYMNELLDEIRATTIECGELQLSKTMTFGLVEGDPEDMLRLSKELKAADDIKVKEKLLKTRMDRYIDEADTKLYYGKENGRNQLVVELPKVDSNIEAEPETEMKAASVAESKTETEAVTEPDTASELISEAETINEPIE